MNPAAGQPMFQMTRWSVVLKAASPENKESQAALSELFKIYWYPLYAFVRRSGYGHHEAEDMTQGLFHQLLSKDGLSKVNPDKGRFRSFLLASIKHYMANEWHKSNAQKRGGGEKLISIDKAMSEERFDNEPASNENPETVYERKWALTLLQNSIEDLRKEYEAQNKIRAFELLKQHLVQDAGHMTYAEIAKDLNISEGNVKVIAHRMRHRFNTILRTHVAQTVETNANIEEEIQHLISCFER